MKICATFVFSFFYAFLYISADFSVFLGFISIYVVFFTPNPIDFADFVLLSGGFTVLSASGLDPTNPSGEELDIN